MLDEQRAPGVYAVLEQLSFVPADISGVKIAVIEHPGGGPTLSIYDLAAES